MYSFTEIASTWKWDTPQSTIRILYAYQIRNGSTYLWKNYPRVWLLNQRVHFLLLFSAPEPKAQVHYCDHTLSVVRRKLSHFWLLLWHRLTEFNKTWRSKIYQVCVFRADRKNKMAAPSSDWLRHSWLFSKTTEGNSKKLDKKQDFNVLYQVCVFRANKKTKMAAPGLWLAETFLTSPLKPLKGISWNLTGSKISTSFTKFVFFRLIGKPRWPPWPLIGGDT